MNALVCRSCAREETLEDGYWRCRCGGLFDLALEVPEGAFSRLAAQPWSLWRYRELLPFGADATAWQSVTLGEGGTPLVRAGGSVRLKLDFVMPTLSYKDRGSVVLVAKALELGARRLVADSSGNAGTSIAAYATRAGIAAEVFVPSSTSSSKVAQLRHYGATVYQVAGSRAEAAAAAIERVEQSGAFYASHVYNPLFHHGTKTFAYELWEQLGGVVPDTVVLPVGNGTLLIGAHLGFAELVAARVVPEMPRLVAVQAARCAPLAGLAPDGETAAEGIAIAEPPRAAQMLEIIERTGGQVVTVEESAIAPARAELAARGLDVEPTAAIGWAALSSTAMATDSGVVVLALTGAGLKSPARAGDG